MSDTRYCNEGILDDDRCVAKGPERLEPSEVEQKKTPQNKGRKNIAKSCQ